jgi:nuclear-control-of-ATPase protein 2
MYKRRELESIRNQKAEALGRLAQLRGTLSSVIKDQPWNTQAFVHVLACIIGGETTTTYAPASVDAMDGTTPSPLPELLRLSTAVFTSQRDSQAHIVSRNLRRPSRLTLIWPNLLLLPPLCIFALRSAYTSRATLAEVTKDARETAEGFINGWLIEPMKEVLHTVRAGGEDGVIVRKEGVAADFDVRALIPLSV